jgi:hypothetical protein
MKQQERLDLAIVELVKLCVKDCINLEFMPPIEDPQEEYVNFVACNRSINIFKDRTDPVSIFHVYALAHEYAHSIQFKEMNGQESWLFDLGLLGCKTDRSVSARLENEADLFAIDFLKKRKIRITKRLREYLDDRFSYHTGVINGG